MKTWNIKNHCVEFLEDDHVYLIDGMIVPSITQILKVKFGNKYDGVNKDVLDLAREKGVKVHEAIEKYCKFNTKEEMKELNNFIFLMKQYKFEVIDNEVPIILFKDDVPIAGGRLDLVLSQNGELGLGDIKRTSSLDKEYLAYQLNLYRIAFQQCFGEEIKFLRGIHLREDVRKYVSIPINEKVAWELVEEYLRGNGNG